MSTIAAFPDPAGVDPDDAVLVARARGGDREAMNALIARHLRDVYDVAARILGDRDLAQDAAQDALVNAMRALSRFRGESSFRTWLLRIASNAALTLARRGGRRREVGLDIVADLGGEGADPIERIADRSMAERVAEALNRLPERQRLAVTLRTYQGLSFREVAEVMGGTEGAARVNYHLGVKRLRELLR